MSNVISGFNEMKVMREFSSSMNDLLDAAKEANAIALQNGVTDLNLSVARLNETVDIINETETILRRFYKGEITIEELEAFRDRVAASRS